MQLGLCSVVLLSLLALSLAAPSALQQREDINFDFGWKFNVGNVFVHCDASAFPKDLSKVECLGLSKVASASNADECRDACCGQTECAIWQYDMKNPDDGCWVGQSQDCQHPNDAWVGGGRNNTPVPPPTGGPAAKDYDDSSWEVVDLPHDGIIGGVYDESAVRSHAYLPLNATWYRKHFNLPTEWKGKSIWVYFEGVFRASTTYLNGKELLYHDSGYTSFSVRLDNVSGVIYGDGKENENVLAVLAGANNGFTGWWYEGGGIYRHNHLVSANPVHIVVDSVYGASKVVGTISDHDASDPTKGQYADVEFYPMVEVVNDGQTQASVKVKFDVIDVVGGGNIKGTTTLNAMTVDSGKTVVVNTTIPKVSGIELWSIARPYLYKLQITVMSASDSSMMDNVTYFIGARQTRWDPDTGFYLNGKHFIWRGFNNHNDFTGVGTAVPDRVNLFRGQMMRAVGANSWRMSHNPPFPVMLDILDSIGVIVWDENRNFGPNPIWVQDQMDMVKRDRNHPSIMAWSFCNEAGCGSGDKGDASTNFASVSKAADPFRPVTANMFNSIDSNLSHTIDVQGFSHQGGSVFDNFHQKVPNKAVIGSECCSCTTMRGEDVADGSNHILSNFNANCNQGQTGNQLNRKFVAGCMVWTLFDYYGEPAEGGWPHVSSSYGSIDLAGFAKASAYWYRSWWYYSAKKNQSDGGYDVPVNPPSLVNPYESKQNPTDDYMIHIVQKWEPMDNMPNRTIQAYTNAPTAELMVNGKSQGKASVNWQGWAEWDKVPYSAGKITANAIDSQNQVKATHTVMTAGAATKVVANLDVPSTATGTGTSLVLDGQDAGMVSAAIVDAQGNVVPSASHNVSFSIVSGPGRIIGVGNGNPMCHEPNKATWRSAFHGLARVIVQTTVNAASPPLHRKRMLQIDRHGGILTRIAPPEDHSPMADAIVVQASVDGLGSSTVSIPVSTNLEDDGVLAAARKSVKGQF